MAETLTLKGVGGDLLIAVAVNEYGWSSCTLLADGRRTTLGADTFDCVAAGLLRAVSDDQEAEVVGQIDGRAVRCALMLSEAHHVLYFADDGADRLLFWQNAGAVPVTLAGTMRLTPAQRRLWRGQLTQALHAYSLDRARRAAITKEIAEIVGGAEALK